MPYEVFNNNYNNRFIFGAVYYFSNKDNQNNKQEPEGNKIMEQKNLQWKKRRK